MSESNQQSEFLIGQLRQLQPAPFQVDVRQAFYQAGYEACRAQTTTRNLRYRAIGIAATLLAVITLVPTSYHLGKTGAISRGAVGLVQSDASEAIHVPVIPVRQRPSAIQATEAAADPERTGVVELAASPKASNPLVSWINPLPSIAKSTKLDRQSESMVTTSHASLFALEGSLRNLSEFPCSLPSPYELATSLETESISPSSEESRPTLAVGDFQSIANTLETTR